MKKIDSHSREIFHTMSKDNQEETDFCFRACNREELAETWPGQCVFVVEEIISTEQSYVSDLENIVKVISYVLCDYKVLYYCTLGGGHSYIIQ